MTEDPKRWKDDESAPEAMREFLAASQLKTPALPDALQAKLLQRVALKRSRVMPVVLGGVLALAAAALLAHAMNTSSVQPAVPPPTLEPEPLDAGPDAPRLEAIEVERVCGEEDVDYACTVQVTLARVYEEVETRQAFGVTPPTCGVGRRVQPDAITQIDAMHFTFAAVHSYGTQRSIRVCAYEHGHLVAEGGLDGDRSPIDLRVTPFTSRDDIAIDVRPLDHDATGLRIVRVREDELTGFALHDASTLGEEDATTERFETFLNEVCARAPEVSFPASAFAWGERVASSPGIVNVNIVHRAMRDDAPSAFVPCVSTERGVVYAGRMIDDVLSPYIWPEEAPMVLTPSGGRRVSEMGPAHRLLTRIVPQLVIGSLPSREPARSPLPVGAWAVAPITSVVHGPLPAHRITFASGRSAILPDMLSLVGDITDPSSWRTVATATEGQTVVTVDSTDVIRTSTPATWRWSLPVAARPGALFVDDILVVNSNVSRGAPVTLAAEDPAQRAEPIRAMPGDADDCVVRTVLEVAEIPEGVVGISVAAVPHRGAEGTLTSMDCTEGLASAELSAAELATVPPDADGVRRVQLDFSPWEPALDVEHRDMDVDRIAMDTYCSTPYAVIACVHDASGVHPLSGARGRWTLTGPACFAADTPIATPSGNRPIASLESGMTVLAFNPETGARSETRVVRLIPRGERPILALALSNGQTMHVTAEHPLFDAEANTFREAGSFAVGDVLRGLDGIPVRVLSTHETEQSAPVFDLSVAGPHTYFANGVAVHNY